MPTVAITNGVIDYWSKRDLPDLDGLPLHWNGEADVAALIGVIGLCGALIGVLASLLVFYLTKRAERRIARREIYQRLELASIDLFRFECENKALVWRLWDAKSQLPDKDTADYYVLKEYVCQILGLFEMAISFSRKGIIDPEVFASWGIWMYELCAAPNFQILWEGDLPLNYVSDLRELLTKGVRICRGSGDHAAMRVEFLKMFQQTDGRGRVQTPD